MAQATKQRRCNRNNSDSNNDNNSSVSKNDTAHNSL